MPASTRPSVGGGAILLPILGGLAAEVSGRLSAPYLLAAAAGIVSIGAQIGFLRGTGTGAAR